MYNKGLVALDGSKQSFKALSSACQLAEAGAVKELGLIYVIGLPTQVVSPDGMGVTFGLSEYRDRQNKVAEEVMDKAREMIGTNIKVETMIEMGSPADTIIKVVEKGQYDLIIIGNRGLNQLKRFFLGSVSTNVVSSAPCSVLVVK